MVKQVNLKPLYIHEVDLYIQAIPEVDEGIFFSLQWTHPLTMRPLLLP